MEKGKTRIIRFHDFPLFKGEANVVEGDPGVAEDQPDRLGASAII